MADQLKATALAQYGNHQVRTPAVEQLAADGVRYELAFTPHPLCVPARVSMWTGAYPHDHGVRTNELRAPCDVDNYLRSFSRAGYRLALFGKDHCFGPGDAALFDRRVEFGHLGGERPEDTAFTDWIDNGQYTRLWHAHRCPIPGELTPAGRITDQTCRFIASGHEGPFLAWVSFPEPHEPYYAIDPFGSWYDPSDIALPPAEQDGLAAKPLRQQLYRKVCGFAEMPEQEMRVAVATYYAMVSFVDHCVGRILGALREHSLHRDTLVVFTADHGDFAGEHGLMVKCGAFYDCLTRIPLLLSWPGVLPQGRTVPHLVSLIDVLPTVAHLTGIEEIAISRGNTLPGVDSTASVRDAVYAEYGAGGRPVTPADAERPHPLDAAPHRPLLRAAEAEGRPKMIRTPRWKYVHDPFDPTDELYDLQEDPWELQNLAPRPEFASVVTELRGRLLDWSIATEDAAPVPLFFDQRTLQPHESAHAATRRDR